VWRIIRSISKYISERENLLFPFFSGFIYTIQVCYVGRWTSSEGESGLGMVRVKGIYIFSVLRHFYLYLIT